MKREAPYLLRAQIRPERMGDPDVHPFSLPAVRALDITFKTSLTFIVGENGSGKSTIMEGLAGLLNLPLSGGGTADAGLRHGPKTSSALVDALRPSFRRRPPDAYFFRGELTSHFGALLDERRDDPDFLGDPYTRYGGRTLATQSHGEGFLAIMLNRIEEGLYLFDEPEVALSPRRQLTLMALIASKAAAGRSQFVIATHSPMLMTIPDATILRIEGDEITPCALEDTEHYQLTKAALCNPGSLWKHLTPDEE